MTVSLIIFIAFHFDGGIASQEVKFENMQLCEFARKQIVDSAKNPVNNDDFGRKRILAKCVFTGKGRQQ